MGSKTVTKLILLIGLLVILTTAAAFIFVASYIIHISGSASELYQATQIFIPTAILLSIGIALVLLVLIGFFGCILEKRTLLGIFFVSLLVVFVFEVSALTVGIIFKNKLRFGLEKHMLDILKDYEHYKQEIDNIQRQYKCCGVFNSSDWHNYVNQSIPDSCCPNNCTQPTSTTTVHLSTNKWRSSPSQTTTANPDSSMPYKDGCGEKFEKFLEKNFVLIVAISATIIILQIISLIATCCIFRKKSSLPYEVFNNRYYV